MAFRYVQGYESEGIGPRNVSRYRGILDTGDVDLGAEDGRKGSDPGGSGLSTNCCRFA